MRITLLVMMFASQTAWAQSLQLINPTRSITASYVNDVHVKIAIKNTSANAVAVKVKRFIISGVPEHINYMCWTVCYDPQVSQSPNAEIIAPGAINAKFEGSMTFDRAKRNKNIGTTVVRYCFFNELNVADSICIDVTYNITAPKSSIVPINPDLEVTSSYEEDLSAKIAIENFSSQPVTVKATMKKLSGPAAHQPYMCFTNCYLPGVVETPEHETIAPGEINSKFTGYLTSDPKNDEAIGISVVRFCFVNVNDKSDSACSDVVYNVTKPTGLEEGLSVAGVKASPVYPSPSSDFIYINYTMPLRVERVALEIYNTLGKTVRTETLDPMRQSIRIDVTNFKSGVYLYRILADGKKSAVKRFVVR